MVKRHGAVRTKNTLTITAPQLWGSSVIEERVDRWNELARSCRALRKSAWRELDSGHLALEFESLPEGFQPLRETLQRGIPAKGKAHLFQSFLNTISCLHESGFHYGFLSIDHLHVEERYHILLDVQPFPSIMPFVDTPLDDYPFDLFSPYARGYTFPRLADFWSAGRLLQWLFPDAAAENSQDGGSPVVELADRLLKQPRQFLTVGEICNEWARLYPATHESAVMQPAAQMNEASNIPLHPPGLPLTASETEMITSFFCDTDPKAIVIRGNDDTARNHVVRTFINRTVERNLYLSIRCTGLPFSTLQSAVRQIIPAVSQYMPELADTLQSLLNELNRNLERHLQGGQARNEMIGWTREFFALLSRLQVRHKPYLVFEHTEMMDADSGELLALYLDRTPEKSGGINLLFTGRSLPEVLHARPMASVDLDTGLTSRMQNALAETLGRADPHTLGSITEGMTAGSVTFNGSMLLLKEWLRRGGIRLSEGRWQAADLEPRPEIQSVVMQEIDKLLQPEKELLSILGVLPSPIRAASLFQNEKESGELEKLLMPLIRGNLIWVYHWNSVFVPEETRLALELGLSGSEWRGAAQRAFQLFKNVHPDLLGPLIVLAEQAGDKRSEYIQKIAYYRSNRALLNTQQKTDLFKQFFRLREELGRRPFYSWQRLLTVEYIRSSRVPDAYETARQLYGETGSTADKALLLHARMFTEDFDADKDIPELQAIIESATLPLKTKSFAASLLIMSDLYLLYRLGENGATQVANFFEEVLLPERDSVSLQSFLTVSISYLLLIGKYMPEKQEWGLQLRVKLELLLEHTPNPYLLQRLYNTYLYQHDLHLANKYNRLNMEVAIRSQLHHSLHVTYLNGVELSIFLGDIHSYRYFAGLTAESALSRKDMQEAFSLYRMLYAVEWQDGDSLAATEKEIASSGFSEPRETHAQLYRAYSRFRSGQSPDVASVDDKWNRNVERFAGALQPLYDGKMEQAIGLLTQSIDAIVFDPEFLIVGGWAYRELIGAVLPEDSGQAGIWLGRFRAFIEKYNFLGFWPDYYELTGMLEMKQGKTDESVLSFKRSVNGYRGMAKEAGCRRATRLLEACTLPAGGDRPIAAGNDPEFRQLVQQRNKYFMENIELRQIFLLCGEIAKSTDYGLTMERLVRVLFDHYPVTFLNIECELPFRKEKVWFNAMGSIPYSMIQNQGDAAFTERTEVLYNEYGHHLTLRFLLADSGASGPETLDMLLQLISPHLNAAIIHEQTKIDTLTGFYVRRHFLAGLEQEFRLAARYRLGLSVLMLDIDNFRLVNEHGHQEGDSVLMEMAALIRSELRKHDMPGRYGGEELLIIMPKTDGKDALKLAERIRQKVEDTFAAGRPYQVTVSIGVACMESCRTASAQELIRLADEAEIAAKRSGKNKVLAAWEHVRN